MPLQHPPDHECDPLLTTGSELSNSNAVIAVTVSLSENSQVTNHGNEQSDSELSDDVPECPSISKTGGWKTCRYILGTEACERLAFFGINMNLVSYLTKVLHQGNSDAATNVSMWSGTGYITPLIGAFLADAYWGRYRTIMTFSIIYFIGLLFLTLSASLPSCLGRDECGPNSALQIRFVFVSLYLIAIGMGGIKPCISAFGADQFDENEPTERKQRVHFFNWYYMSINIGGLLASTVLIYIQDNLSWAFGFGIPTAAMTVAVCCFIFGRPLYRLQKPGGSHLIRTVQVIISAIRKCFAKVPSDETVVCGVSDPVLDSQRGSLPHNTNNIRLLDKAPIKVETDQKGGRSRNKWIVCSVSEVDEVKQLLRLFPIWVTSIFFSTVYAQLSTTFVEQGSRMDNKMGQHFHIPPASMSTFEIITVILMVPVYDRVLIRMVYKVSKIHGGFTQLQRMGIGLFISILSMLASFFVEAKRLNIAKSLDLLHDSEKPVPMSIFWQVPQIVLIGISETFTYIGQLEFFYDQVPDNMRSLGTALALATFSLGNYLNSLILVIVAHMTGSSKSPGWIPDNLNLGHLDYYFALLAAISFFNFLWYLRCANSFRYKERRTTL